MQLENKFRTNLPNEPEYKNELACPTNFPKYAELLALKSTNEPHNIISSPMEEAVMVALAHTRVEHKWVPFLCFQRGSRQCRKPQGGNCGYNYIQIPVFELWKGIKNTFHSVGSISTCLLRALLHFLCLQMHRLPFPQCCRDMQRERPSSWTATKQTAKKNKRLDLTSRKLFKSATITR